MSLAERLESVRRSQQAAEANAGSQTPAAAHERQRVADPFGVVKASVHQALLDSLGPQLYDPHLDQAELESKVRHTLQEVIDHEETPLSLADRTRISQEVADEILGHGPLEPLLRDSEITEIMVNGPDQIYVERAGKLYPVETHFSSDAHLRRTIDKIVGRVGRRVDEASPLVDARLPDGSRVNAVIPPIALDGSLLTIRKFATDPFTDKDLIAFGTFTPQVRDFLSACVRGRRNIVISGGTGSGKTTLLNVVSSFIPDDERIVTIEDAAELQLKQDHVLRLESRPSNIEGRGRIDIRELVKNALRMRPDRIVVGECRDGAALDMLQAMNTGHDGSLTTVHANSPRDSLARLETMVLMAGVDLPVRAIREQVAGAVDMVIQQARMKDGSRRVTAISEVIGMEGEIITMQDLFAFDYAAGRDEQGRFRGTLKSTGLRPKFATELHDQGIELAPDIFVRGL
ncbi:pilus assembly protein CpaF [Phycicoccus badiiscoriae]|uniref:Pilus assembly protein CpaF n=1 Tax=Pedococcus badiiscoriae TaxID=642776 RepID=A0A852WLP7_9MICO|nr:CpaF family protein [Pedococcus badiiscoriae]NYG07704.1 pilus assembly protein CpaF [Pedococcus badiiscoriae]